MAATSVAARLWLCGILASGPALALQPCDPTQPWPCLQSTNSPLTEFATSQGCGQSGSAALPASAGITLSELPLRLVTSGAADT